MDISAEQGLVTTAYVSRPSITSMVEAEVLSALREATLGKYDIKGELGRGGMAIVYLAHDIALDRKVAIKVISPTVLSTPGVEARFRREAKTAASLSHPNIIPIYTVDETDRIMYFVMKYVSGRPLDSVINKIGAMPIRMITTVLSQVAGALEYAHRQGVIHRDIKPANVIIDEEGWAMVTDFGIAKIADAENLTASDAAVGTPSYMSPEQCSGLELTGASDQYALGIMAYEMLTGHVPFRGTSMMEIMKQHFFEEPIPVEDVRPGCPETLARCVHRLLAKEAAKRFSTLEQLVFALDAKPLARDDPIRTQLIDLAVSGEKEKVVTQLKTPRSPIPSSKHLAQRERTPVSSGTATEVTTVPDGPLHVRKSHWKGVLVGVFSAVVVLAGGWVGITQLRQSSGTGESTVVEPPATGTVMVTGLPAGARVLANGVPQTGPTFPLGSGSHNIRIEAEGFAPFVDSVGIRGGDTVSIRYPASTLALAEPDRDVAQERPVATEEQRPASAPIRTNPRGAGAATQPPPPQNVPGVLQLRLNVAAELIVDGASMGTRPRHQAEVKSGVPHIVMVQRDGYAPWDTTLTISAGDTVQIPLRLVQNRGLR